MKAIQIGVVGIGRGKALMKDCLQFENVKVVAVCDKRKDEMDKLKEKYQDSDIGFYTDYDKFLEHSMDVVLLANYATQHAPFAIKALEHGFDVFSEVLPAQNMAEAVSLIECKERTGKKYCYLENYCFMGAPYEMKKKYQSGELGEIQYAEGEYLHDCESIWADATYGEREHWRNNMSAFFYCTHSVGPLLHLCGIRPQKVMGFEGTFNPKAARMGARAGGYGIEMVTLENGAILKSIHGVAPSRSSVWYSVYGENGRMESMRENGVSGAFNKVYADLDSAPHAKNDSAFYNPVFEGFEEAAGSGHGGSDYICLKNALAHIRGEKNADIIDVYEALDMWMCGHFAHLSCIEKKGELEIPNLRKKEVRDSYRNDNRCTDPTVAGEQLLPSYTKQKLNIPDEVYAYHKQKWNHKQQEDKK